jgi:hypothetical protein
MRNNSDINITPVKGCSLKHSFDCFFAANFLGSMFFFWAVATAAVFRLMTDRSDGSHSGPSRTETLPGQSREKPAAR